MTIRQVTERDIPAWRALSKEYDQYIQKIHPNFAEWYEGNATSPSFDAYMKSKIEKREAFITTGEHDACLGIVAFSIAHHRITFLGISHSADLDAVGQLLFDIALTHLGTESDISMTLPKCAAQRILDEKRLAERNGFRYIEDADECGCPVERLVRLA